MLRKKLLVGRRSSCDISLRFPNVSSHHCEVELINGYWHVRDLGSTNGIKVNGIRCDQKWLMPGDVLSVAKHRYEVLYEPQTEAPPPEEEDPLAVGLLEKAGLAGRKRDEPSSSTETLRHQLIEDDVEDDLEDEIDCDPEWLEDDEA